MQMQTHATYHVPDAHPNLMTAYPGFERDLKFVPADPAKARTLSRRHVEQFNADGFLKPFTAMSEANMEEHRALFDGLLAGELASGRGSYSMDGLHNRVAELYDIVLLPSILNVVEDLLGPNLVCWGTHYFCKMAGDRKQVSWHQDASFWPLTPSRNVTVWLAIDQASVENGCMRVIPGSHLHGQIAFRRSQEQEQSVLNQTVENPFNYGGDPVDVELRPGQFSVHSDLLLHGSNPNMSTRRRCGLTIRYIPASVRAPSDWRAGQSIICRGTDPATRWSHAPRPKAV